MSDEPVAAPAHRKMGARLLAVRTRVRSVPGGAIAWRIGITIIGVAVIAIGVVLLPLPGPGWVIIFAGLGLLATEYSWASRLLTRARRLVASSATWARDQPLIVRVGLVLLTIAFVGAILFGSWFLARRV